MAAVMIILTVLTAPAASLASATQDTPETAETRAKVVYTLKLFTSLTWILSYSEKNSLAVM